MNQLFLVSCVECVPICSIDLFLCELTIQYYVKDIPV